MPILNRKKSKPINIPDTVPESEVATQPKATEPAKTNYSSFKPSDEPKELLVLPAKQPTKRLSDIRVRRVRKNK